MSFTLWLTVSFLPPLPVAFPSALVAAASAVIGLSPDLKYYSTVRRLTPHRVPFRLSTYRVAYPDASRERRESSWGHAPIFRTVPSAHTFGTTGGCERLRLHSAGSTWPRLWPTGSSVGSRPSITARYCSSCPSDSTSRWTPCPPVACRQSPNVGHPLAVSAVSGCVPV
jgi:hypothetical protein